MFIESLKATFSALRLLFKSWSTLLLLVIMYSALLLAGYLFVSTREATIGQLVMTLALIVITPALFFAFQAVSVNYTSGAASTGLLKKTAYDCLRLIAVSVPLILLTLLAIYGLGKISSHDTIVVAARYLLVGVIAPLVAIQLWLAASRDGLRSLWRRLHHIAARAFAPQTVFVYACGILFFGVAPYLLIFETMHIGQAWLEVSVLALRLFLSAVLILLGWVTTVGTLSILAKH